MQEAHTTAVAAVNRYWFIMLVILLTKRRAG